VLAVVNEGPETGLGLKEDHATTTKYGKRFSIKQETIALQGMVVHRRIL